MEAEQPEVNKKTKRDDSHEQDENEPQKKVKLTLEEEEEAKDRQWRAEREADIKRVVTEIRTASQHSVTLLMIQFFQRCHPELYVDESRLPPFAEYKWGIQGVTLGLVKKAESCARFYDVYDEKDRDHKLYRDYKLCEGICDLHTFHTVARLWSHEPGLQYGSYQQCVLFHTLRHHMLQLKTPLQPVLMRLMAIAQEQHYFTKHKPLKKVPAFAKIMLAVMHYSDVQLMRPDPETGRLEALWDNIKKPGESFEILVRHSLFPDKERPLYRFERTDSLRLVAEEARRLIVQRYNTYIREGRWLFYDRESHPGPIGIVVATDELGSSGPTYIIPDMRWY